MKRKKKPSGSETGSLATFLKLAKADALLFGVTELFRSMDLEEIVEPVEQVRADIAQRLKTCQDEAYADMRFSMKRGVAARPLKRPLKKRRAPSK